MQSLPATELYRMFHKEHGIEMSHYKIADLKSMDRVELEQAYWELQNWFHEGKQLSAETTKLIFQIACDSGALRGYAKVYVEESFKMGSFDRGLARLIANGSNYITIDLDKIDSKGWLKFKESTFALGYGLLYEKHALSEPGG